MSSKDKQPEPKFEEAFQDLEQIVSQFENGQLGLEESVELYRRATRLLGICRQKLSAAEIGQELWFLFTHLANSLYQS